MSIPIYQGGALRAQVKIATAQQEQAVAQYGAAVLNAFREAEDAIANELLLAKRIPFAESALTDRTKAVEIATLQYQAGRRDLLWVSELQAQQLLAEEALIRLRSTQGSNLIRLYLALGGSFDSTPAVPADIANTQEN
jgi:outer membrane protein TolC